MSDSNTVTIPAAKHAATAETRSAWILRALAQNPEPLSTPALASLLAEPGRRRRLLASRDHTLCQHEQAGHVERQAASVKDAAGLPLSGVSPAQVAAGSTTATKHQSSPRPPPEAQRKTEQAKRMAAERDEALDQGRPIFTRQTPRISRKRAAHRLRELGCTLDQIGAVFHVSKERIRQDLLWDPRGTVGRPKTSYSA